MSSINRSALRATARSPLMLLSTAVAVLSITGLIYSDAHPVRLFIDTTILGCVLVIVGGYLYCADVFRQDRDVDRQARADRAAAEAADFAARQDRYLADRAIERHDQARRLRAIQETGVDPGPSPAAQAIADERDARMAQSNQEEDAALARVKASTN